MRRKALRSSALPGFEYDGADLVKITDALGRVVQRFTDGAGRVVGMIDPLGNLTRLDYDVFDQLLKQTDALGNTVESTYDLNGNRLTFKDPRGNLTQYAYDDLNRMINRKRVALPPRIFRIMLSHSLALTGEDDRGERRSEVGVLGEAYQGLASEWALASCVLPTRRT